MDPNKDGPLWSRQAVGSWGLRIFGLLASGWVVFLLFHSHLPRRAPAPSAHRTAASTSVLYVVRHSWHAGLAVRRTDLPDDRWPVPDHFSNAEYLEIGWGEAGYYPARNPGTGALLKAGLWPTKSVLHVVPLPASAPSAFPGNTVVRVPVNPNTLRTFIGFVADSFTEDPMVTAPGLSPGRQFYRSDLHYHAFNNCNHWAAAALEAAGCDTAPRRTFTVGQVIEQAERCGTRVQAGSTN